MEKNQKLELMAKNILIISFYHNPVMLAITNLLVIRNL
jgi:hypothetical protein